MYPNTHEGLVTSSITVIRVNMQSHFLPTQSLIFLVILIGDNDMTW